MTTWIGIIVVAPIFTASVIAMGIGATQSFGHSYAETLCRMESVRTHAIEQLQKDQPLTANFGGTACDNATLPEVTVVLIDPTPEPTPDAPPAGGGVLQPGMMSGVGCYKLARSSLRAATVSGWRGQPRSIARSIWTSSSRSSTASRLSSASRRASISSGSALALCDSILSAM